jgi:hypothetical protein
MTADGTAIFDSRFEVETSHPWFTETDGAGQTVICFPPADPETDPVVKRLGGWRWSLHYKVESIH